MLSAFSPHRKATNWVALPGFRDGDPILALVFVVDLAALALAAVPALAARGRADRRTGWWLMGVCAAAAVGDGFVAAGGSSFAFTAICWIRLVPLGPRPWIPSREYTELSEMSVAAWSVIGPE